MVSLNSKDRVIEISIHLGYIFKRQQASFILNQDSFHFLVAVARQLTTVEQ